MLFFLIMLLSIFYIANNMLEIMLELYSEIWSINTKLGGKIEISFFHIKYETLPF